MHVKREKALVEREFGTAIKESVQEVQRKKPSWGSEWVG